MRKKTPKTVITFPSTFAATAFEAAAQEHGIPGRIIPVPSAISAGCGLSWCAPIADQPKLEQAITDYSLDIEGLHIVELY